RPSSRPSCRPHRGPSSSGSYDLALRFHLDFGFRLDQDFGHAPALFLRHRTGLDDADLVARLRRLLLVVALVLLLLGQVLAVLAVLGPLLDAQFLQLGGLHLILPAVSSGGSSGCSGAACGKRGPSLPGRSRESRLPSRRGCGPSSPPRATPRRCPCRAPCASRPASW